MAIARFVNAAEIVEIYNERNPNNPIGKDTAYGWRDEWKAEHPNARFPNKNVVPYLWFEEVYGEDAYRGLNFTLDTLTLAKLDVLRAAVHMSRSEFISMIIDKYAKEKDTG